MRNMPMCGEGFGYTRREMVAAAASRLHAFQMGSAWHDAWNGGETWREIECGGCLSALEQVYQEHLQRQAEYEAMREESRKEREVMAAQGFGETPRYAIGVDRYGRNSGSGLDGSDWWKKFDQSGMFD